jgi:uncharacterized protein YceH (UPF0502 family)
VSDPLTDVDVRVLGSLIEKEQTTPEYYPLSLNALVTACNQSSNRDPVVKYDEGTVSRSIDALRQRGMVRAVKGIDARVPKYSHRIEDVLNLNIQELAILCVLFLRGAQTSGELRTRTERIESFEDLTAVEATLDRLITRELVVRLPRQPGQKEVRYAHLLAGEVQAATQSSSIAAPTPATASTADRIAALEATVEQLKTELDDLRAQVVAFRAQFE